MLSIQVFVDFGKVKYVRNINSNDKYRNEIMQKIRTFSAVQKVRALPKDWPTLRSLFSGNLIDH